MILKGKQNNWQHKVPIGDFGTANPFCRTNKSVVSNDIDSLRCCHADVLLLNYDRSYFKIINSVSLYLLLDYTFEVYLFLIHRLNHDFSTFQYYLVVAFVLHQTVQTKSNDTCVIITWHWRHVQPVVNLETRSHQVIASA